MKACSTFGVLVSVAHQSIPIDEHDLVADRVVECQRLMRFVSAVQERTA